MLASPGHHDRPIGEGVRADGRHDQHVQSRIHDRPAAGERIGGRAGGGRHHQAIAPMRVQVAPVHGSGNRACDRLRDAAAPHRSGPGAASRPLAAVQARFEQAAPVQSRTGHRAWPRCWRPISRGSTSVRNPKPAAIDAQQRDLAAHHQAGRPAARCHRRPPPPCSWPARPVAARGTARACGPKLARLIGRHQRLDARAARSTASTAAALSAMRGSAKCPIRAQDCGFGFMPRSCNMPRGRAANGALYGSML